MPIDFARLSQRMGAHINGGPGQRAAAQARRSVPIYACNLAWAAIALLSGYHPGIARQSIVAFLAWAAFGVLTGSALAMLVPTRTPRAPGRGFERLYAAGVRTVIAVLNGVTCFLVGPFTLLSGAAIGSLGLMGTIVMPPRENVLQIGVMIASIIVLATLQHAGVIAFPPLLQDHASGYVITIEFMAVVILISYDILCASSLVRQWQVREFGVRALSVTDALSGTANRRHILELLAQQLAESSTAVSPVSLIMLDLDNFKQVNDTHGHQAGDRAIKAIACAICANVRQQDAVGRYGGDEFLVVLPGAELPVAQRVAERCRNAIAATHLAECPELPLTVSCGVACRESRDDTGVDALIQRADRALYRAKQRGRNRVACADPDVIASA